MDTAKLSRPFQLLAAGALTAVMLSPCIARAVGIGEVVRQSRLGEPFFAQVQLTIGSGESIDASCLSLALPDPHDDEAGNYVFDAKLEIKTEGARWYAVVSSRKPLNEAFAKFRLQVNCPGTGSLTKTLTILPELDAMSPTATPATATLTTARGSFGEGASASRAALPAMKRQAHATSKKQERQATLMLKISSGPIVESRIAGLLVPQQQVKQHADRLGGLKLKLAWLINSASAAESPVPPVAATLESALAPADARPAAAVQGPVPQGSPMLQRGLLVAGLALVITALMLLLRRRGTLRSRLAAMPVLRHVAAKIEAVAIPMVSLRKAAQVSAATVSAAPPPAGPQIEKKGMTDDDTMLEEAELFAVHGHANRAIELLHEVTAQNPAHTEAWMLLFSVLSSLGRVEEFERAARDFLKHNKNSESWEMLQTLGRTLDQGNPLYVGDGGASAIFLPQLAIKKRRPVGHILVETGALSVRGMKNCLADFDPKVHGRFGGYLVSRKLVTLAQLNEALLKQKGAGA